MDFISYEQFFLQESRQAEFHHQTCNAASVIFFNFRDLQTKCYNSLSKNVKKVAFCAK